MNPRADIGPKPSPTPRPPNPKPSGPGRGHLPIGAELPDLDDLLDAADILGSRLIGLLNRGYDPATGPADGSVLHGYVGIRLRCAAADVRSALALLSQVRAEFPTSPARQDPVPARGASIATPGGPPKTTRMDPGERLSPGYAAVPAARESVGVPAPKQASNVPPPTAGQRADTPARTIGAPAAVVEARGTLTREPEAGVQLLNRSAVAELFGVDPQTVTIWAREGRLEYLRPAGGPRVYREPDVRALLAADGLVKTPSPLN